MASRATIAQNATNITTTKKYTAFFDKHFLLFPFPLSPLLLLLSSLVPL